MLVYQRVYTMITDNANIFGMLWDNSGICYSFANTFWSLGVSLGVSDIGAHQMMINRWILGDLGISFETNLYTHDGSMVLVEKC